MIIGYQKLYAEHQWKLGNNIVDNVSSVYILHVGVAFNNNLKKYHSC